MAPQINKDLKPENRPPLGGRLSALAGIKRSANAEGGWFSITRIVKIWIEIRVECQIYTVDI